MQTGNSQRWVIVVLVLMIAVAVGFIAFATKDLWAPSSTDNTAYNASDGQSDGAANGQFPNRGQYTGDDNAADASGSKRGAARAAQSGTVSATVNSSAITTTTANSAPLASAPALTPSVATNNPSAPANNQTAAAPVAKNTAPASSYVMLTGTLGLMDSAITSQPAVVGASGARLLDAPNGKLVASLTTGTLLEAVAGSADQSWVKVQGYGQGGGQSGWIAASQLLLADPTSLPVVNDNSSAPVTTPVTTTAPANLLVQAAPTSNNAAAQVPAAQATGAPTTGVQATVNSGSSRLHIRSGPSTGDAIIGTANSGEQYTVTGRNSDNSWLQINTNGSENGWVSAAYVTVTGEIDSLPIVGS
jgi:hypothetical protein